MIIQHSGKAEDPGTARILIIDDDVRICRSLQAYLEYEGFTVTTAGDGRAMWKICEESQPDIVLLDIMLPGVDGITLAIQLRAKCPGIGIIMLTAKDADVDTIVGLEVGADDYVTKPFDNRVLLARIHSVLRRLVASRRPPESQPNILRFENWCLTLDCLELQSHEGEKVELSVAEFKLLQFLAENVGRIMSREQILQGIANRSWQPGDRSVDVLVGKLRKTLETNPAHPLLIRTIRNLGYQFTAKVEWE